MPKTVTSKSQDQTHQLAAQIGANLKGGETIELVSDVGGGKTTFTKGLVRGAGSGDYVSSPTFTVCNMYIVGPNRTHADGAQGSNEQRTNRTHVTESESRRQLTQRSAASDVSVSNSSGQQDSAVRRIWHFDFYRLPEAGIIEHQLHETVDMKRDVTVVEWSDVVKHVLPAKRLTIHIKSTGENSRNFTFDYPDSLQYLLDDVDTHH